MSVRTILAAKGGDVVTIAPDATLAQAAQLLAARRIGALVVSAAERRVEGILSERDIVRAVARGGASSLEEPVAAHMTQKVATATQEFTVVAVMELMTDGRFRHVPVIEADRLVGLVSIGDLVKQRLAEMEDEKKAMLDYIATA